MSIAGIRQRWLLIVGLLALVAALGVRPGATSVLAQEKAPEKAPTTKPESAPCDGPEDFKPVQNLGLACQMPDKSWKVMLADGTIVTSHGPDPAPKVIRASDPAARESSAVNCVSNSSYHALMLYVYPTDRADQYGARLGTIRSYVQGMQDKLNSESMRFGVSSSFNFACDPDGQVTVRRVPLSISSAQHDIAAITNDLKAKGYNSTLEKYWIMYEQPACGGGVAWAESDDRPVVDNGANRGPSYGISWGFCGFDTLMHEAGHTLGAVMNSAPNTTGGFHCIDGNDIMCYNDGGPRGGLYNPNVCSDYQHWDCNNNDYFHPNPPAGSYLATHWNLGACYLNFIVRSGCGTTPPPPSGGAYFYLINRNSNQCLDLSNASSADGAKIQQWGCNGSSAQQWRLAPVNGSYQLVSRASNKCADVEAWSTADGALVKQWSCGNAQNNQLWNFATTSDGWTRLVSRNSGKDLSIQYGSTTAGTAAHQWPWIGSADQQWRLEPVGGTALVNANSNKCVDVSNGGSADGTNIQQWTCNNSNAQKWSFQHTNNGYYRLISLAANKPMDVAGNSTADGANIHIWSNTGCACQEFRIELQSDGTARLVARHSGKVIDVAGSGTGDGTNVQQWTWNGSNAQRFRFAN
ncbi:MAG TPA: RICIN domain-containing protein [Herpetosiphonaceae bacterium]